MRKITAILMISLMVLLILAIAGCKKQTSTTDEPASTDVQPVKDLPETKETSGTLNEAQEIESDINDEGVKNLDQELDEITW